MLSGTLSKVPSVGILLGFVPLRSHEFETSDFGAGLVNNDTGN